MAQERIDELKAERASLAAGAGQEQAGHDNFYGRICRLEVHAATCNGELDVIVKPVRSLEDCVAAGETLKIQGKIGLTILQTRFLSFTLSLKS